MAADSGADSPNGIVVHFEIQADDPARAKQFYEQVFGWAIDKSADQEYWSVTTGRTAAAASGPVSRWGGIDGGMVPRKGAVPVHDNPISAYVCTIMVADIDSSLRKVIAQAGNVVVDIYAVPGLGRMCYCKDTEGNTFGLMQADLPAAE